MIESPGGTSSSVVESLRPLRYTVMSKLRPSEVTEETSLNWMNTRSDCELRVNWKSYYVKTLRGLWNIHHSKRYGKIQHPTDEIDENLT